MVAKHSKRPSSHVRMVQVAMFIDGLLMITVFTSKESVAFFRFVLSGRKGNVTQLTGTCLPDNAI